MTVGGAWSTRRNLHGQESNLGPSCCEATLCQFWIMRLELCCNPSHSQSKWNQIKIKWNWTVSMRSYPICTNIHPPPPRKESYPMLTKMQCVTKSLQNAQIQVFFFHKRELEKGIRYESFYWNCRSLGLLQGGEKNCENSFVTVKMKKKKKKEKTRKKHKLCLARVSRPISQAVDATWQRAGSGETERARASSAPGSPAVRPAGAFSRKVEGPWEPRRNHKSGQ